MGTPYSGGSAWMAFVLPQYLGSTPRAVCSKDASTKGLSCFQTNTNVITIGSNFSPGDSRQTIPMFGFADSNFKQISLSYQDTTCPAACPSSTPTPTPISTPVTSPTIVISTPTPTPSKACTNQASGFYPPSGSSCFRVIGHGLSHIEGKYLTKPEGWGNPVLGWPGYETPSTFYIDSNGYMYESYQGSVMATDRTDGGAWMQFVLPQYWTSASPKAVCTKNAATKGLSCFQTTTNVITVENTLDNDDSRSVTPMFGAPYEIFKPITFTYEDIACPAPCAPSNTSTPIISTPATSAVPSPSASASCSNSISWVASAGSTCFTVTGHGPQHIEGQILGMKPGYSGASFGWAGWDPATFSIDAAGNFWVASETGNGWVMATLPVDGYSPWISFFPPNGQYDGKAYPRAVCSLRASDKSIQCSLNGLTTFYVAPTHNFYSDSDSRSGNPIFGVPSGPWVSATLTYNEVACPVRCAANSSAPATLPTSTSSPAYAQSTSTPSYSSISPPSSTVPSEPSTFTSTPTVSSSSASPTPTADEMQPCGGYSPGGNFDISGTTYSVYCGVTGSSPVTKLDAIFLPTFKGCMASCSTKTGCKAVMFREIAPVSGAYQCTRYSALGLPQDDGLDWEGTFDVAFLANGAPS